MQFKRNFCRCVAFFVLFLFLFPVPVYAYLDPGGTSYFLQIVLASLVGAVFAVRNVIFRFKTFILKLFTKKGASK